MPYLSAPDAGGRPIKRINSNESFSSLSLAIKAMTRFGPSSYGNLQVGVVVWVGVGGLCKILCVGGLCKTLCCCLSRANQCVGWKSGPPLRWRVFPAHLLPPTKSCARVLAPVLRPACLQGMAGLSKSDSSSKLYHGSPYLSKLESISSSAVRAADKVGASLIVVYTHTGAVMRLGCAGFGAAAEQIAVARGWRARQRQACLHNSLCTAPMPC
jgi:hypothetical protein